MRLGCFLTLAAVGLLWIGGQGVYTAATNFKPADYTVQEFIEKRPSAKWLHLTGGVYNLLDVNYSSFLASDKVNTVWAPLLPVSSDPKQQVHILVKSEDKALLALVQQIQRLHTDEEAMQFLLQHHDEMTAPRDVKGLVQFGVDLEDREQRKLRSLNPNLATDFIVLKEGEQPDLAFSLFTLAGGVVLGGWLLKNAASPAKPVVITGLPKPDRPPPLP